MFGAGDGKGGGRPESVTEFLYCRDTAGPPLRGGNMGPDEEDGVIPGCFLGQVCKASNGEATYPREGWVVVLPSPGGSTEGVGRRAE